MIGIISATLVVLGIVVLSATEPQKLADFFVAVSGVFIGGGIAYELQNRREEATERKEQVKVGNLTILKLIETYESIATYRKQSIDPYRDDHPGRSFITLLPTAGNPIAVPEISFGDLDFLLGSRESAEQLHRLVTFVARCRALQSTIETRDAIHYQQAQPALAESGAWRNFVSSDAVERALGPQITNSLKILTNEVVEFTDVLEREALDNIGMIRSSLTTSIPGGRLIDFKPHSDSKNPENSNKTA